MPDIPGLSHPTRRPPGGPPPSPPPSRRPHPPSIRRTSAPPPRSPRRLSPWSHRSLGTAGSPPAPQTAPIPPTALPANLVPPGPAGHPRNPAMAPRSRGRETRASPRFGASSNGYPLAQSARRRRGAPPPPPRERVGAFPRALALRRERARAPQHRAPHPPSAHLPAPAPSPPPAAEVIITPAPAPARPEPRPGPPHRRPSWPRPDIRRPSSGGLGRIRA